MPRKVCVVIIGRANYGRIKTVLDAVNKRPDLELQIVGASSLLLDRYGKGADVVRRDGFIIDVEAFMAVEGETPLTMAKSVGLGILEITNALNQLKPDVVLTIADRFETIATAIAASYMNIPVAHTQGGEVTGSIDEHVRHAVTKLSHIHFPATKISGERLIKMGEDPATVHVTGCPAIDITASMERNFSEQEKQDIAYMGVGPEIDLSQPYLLMLQHPVTTEYGSGEKQILETIQAVHETGIQTIALWPNIDAGSDEISGGIRKFREYNKDVKIRFYKNFPPDTYARLLANAACLVGNSSSFIREGSYLGTPAVLVGTRQGGREHGLNAKVEVPYDKASILDAIKEQLEHGRYEADFIFGDGNAGERIAEILATADFRIQKKISY